MKKLTIIFAIALLISCAAFGFTPAKAETGFGNGFVYTGEKTEMNVYGGCSLSVVSKENAAEEGVPEGFLGESVLVAQSATSSFDMTLDFTPLDYSRIAILGVSFRLYVEKTEKDNAGYPELRIPADSNGNSWILRSVIGSAKTGQWVTVTLDDNTIDKLCQGGKLGKFVLALRNNAVAKMYIDGITVDTLPTDENPPVITAAITEFKVTEGTYPDLSYITATDDSGLVEIKYEWSENALDYNGRLTLGNHSCTVKAVDGSGNVSQVVITYTVVAETPVEVYSLIFRREGRDDIVAEYTRGTESYVKIPELESKEYYTLKWKDFEFEYTVGQVVEFECYATPYTVTYVADGKIVGYVVYSVENTDFDIPSVPEKVGFVGKWEEHEFNFTNITVNAVYNEKNPDSSSVDESIGSESVKPSQSDGSHKEGNGCSSSVSVGSSLFVLLSAAIVTSAIKRKIKK